MFQDQETMTGGLPVDYKYCYTGHALEILQSKFPLRLQEIANVLCSFHICQYELEAQGGNRTKIVIRLTKAFQAAGTDELGLPTWRPEVKIGTHKIDLFAPGIALEIEWNNKNPFFDRDLSAFQRLYRSAEIKVGIIITRGPDLQRLLEWQGLRKYGKATTHWDKLMPLVDEKQYTCPLMLVGIPASRITENNTTKEHRAWREPSLFEGEYE